MKRFCILTVIVLMLFAFAGCAARIDYTLPAHPIEFNTGTFVNPDDADDTYLSIEYNGRIYIGYGTLKSVLDGDDVGECLGYIVQDGIKDENFRVFPLSDDPDTNYLVRLTVKGMMDQPDFFRAIDTAGKNIHTPDYIVSQDYDFWK